jgi:chaperonin GroES
MTPAEQELERKRRERVELEASYPDLRQSAHDYASGRQAGYFGPVRATEMPGHKRALLDQAKSDGFPYQWEPSARGFAVLVEPMPVEEVTEGGIVKPQAANERVAHATQVGVVIDHGVQCWVDRANGEPWVKPGDRVIFVKYAGATIEFNGREYRFLKDEDIIGSFKRKE